MRVHGVSHRTIAVADDGWSVAVIDQTRLPFAFEQVHLRSAAEAAAAIRDMIVRGAPLIGVTAAYAAAVFVAAVVLLCGVVAYVAVLRVAAR